MADILATLGIASKPDPNLYQNQKEVAGQITTAKDDLKQTLSSVNLAIAGVNLVPGVPQDVIDSLTGLRSQTQTLIDSTSTSPDQLEKQRIEIESKLKNLESTREELMQAGLVKDLTEALDAITKRNEEIKSDTTVSASLKDKYKKLFDEATAALKAAQAKLVAVKSKKEGFQPMTPAPAPGPAGVAAAALEKTAQQFFDELAELDTQKEDEESKEFQWKRFFLRIWGTISSTLFYISLGIAATLGGIILANLYTNTGYWGTRIFYFVYGAAMFPLVLLYGMIRPPIWYSTFIPMYQKNPSNPGSLDGLFGYTLMDPNTTNPEVLADKRTLRILIALSGGVLILQGGFTYLKKFIASLKS